MICLREKNQSGISAKQDSCHGGGPCRQLAWKQVSVSASSRLEVQLQHTPIPKCIPGGEKKKKNQGFHSGAQCHDPCILVTWPQAESYLKGDFLLLAHHFLYISSITYVREMSWFYAVLVS